MLAGIGGARLLEVGCGEGFLLQLIAGWRPELSCIGIDLSERLFGQDVRCLPKVGLSTQTACQLGFPDNSFDLVVAAEILEHLENPDRALEELRRVSKGYVLLSVPREPLWRIMNMARFAYVTDLGNTPGHLQHWSSRQFVSLVAEYFDVVRVEKPIPWTMVLARRTSS